MTVHHPNFFVIGVVKGGTTSLHYYLDQHPEIYMSPVKETNYFSRNDINPAHFSKDYAHDVNVDLQKYLKTDLSQKIHIAHVTEEGDYLQLFRNVEHEKAIGEVSNSYILYPQAVSLIREKYPDAKIIAMLRDPAERAYSQYIMNIRLGKTLETDFIRELQADDAKRVRGWGVNHQYLYIGKYYKQLKRYFDTFPREQIKVCFFLDYKNDPDRVIRSIYQFLGVDEAFVPDTSEKLNTAGVPRFNKLNYWINQNGLISWAKRKLPLSWRDPFKKWMYSSDGADIPQMTREERAWLIDYYREDIQKLSELLNEDLTRWLK